VKTRKKEILARRKLEGVKKTKWVSSLQDKDEAVRRQIQEKPEEKDR